MLKLEQVSFTAPISSAPLLHDISFQVNRGDRVAIVGASGAGKTTLLRLLNRLHEPTSGAIYLEGKPLRQVRTIDLRRQVVLVPQESKLLGMTVQQAIAYPLVLQQLRPQEIRQRLESWRSRLPIPDDWLDRQELQLSLGQRQWVAIARALVMQPQVLLLDEPTSALDVGNAHHLIDLLIQLAQETQMTILMVNHQLDLAQKFACQVLYLQQGKLLEDTPAPQVDWLDLKEKLIQLESSTADW
jgi:D-methionine transport system ATP-binding protein